MTSHPLDPLSSDEFNTVAAVLGRDHGVGDGWRFASIEMIEPTKSEVAAFDASGTVPARRAVSVVLNRTIVPSGALAAGVPAVIKEGKARVEHIDEAVQSYIRKGRRFKQTMRRID